MEKNALRIEYWFQLYENENVYNWFCLDQHVSAVGDLTDLFQRPLANSLSWQHQGGVSWMYPSILHMLCYGMNQNLNPKTVSVSLWKYLHTDYNSNKAMEIQIQSNSAITPWVCCLMSFFFFSWFGSRWSLDMTSL